MQVGSGEPESQCSHFTEQETEALEGVGEVGDVRPSRGQGEGQGYHIGLDPLVLSPSAVQA